MAYGKFNSIVGLVIWYHPTEKEVAAISLYYQDLEHVIIVDNSDTDNGFLCKALDHITYIPCLENKGIAAALNIGCTAAMQMGAEWVLTMDQDSLWNQYSVPQYIEEALQYEAFERVAIFSPFHDCDGTPEKHKKIGRFQPMEVIMCSGNLLRLKAWNESGGFREDFFIDMVDDEMSCHLRQLGWLVIRTNHILLTHKLGNGVQYLGPTHHRYTTHPAWRYYYIARNMQYMAQLYPERARYYHYRTRKEIKRLILYEWSDKRNRFSNFMRGLRDGRKGLLNQSLQITLSPQYEQLRPWLAKVLHDFHSQGEILYNERNQLRIMEAPNGLKIVIKQYHQPNVWKCIVYSLFRTPKAERAFHNAQLLTEKLIPTPSAIGFARNKGFWLKESFLITTLSPLTRNFYEFRYHNAAGYEDIIQAFAQLVADMHQKGLYHRDLSPGNILFDKQKDGTVVFDIIDINRLNVQRISKRDACRNFCRLWGRTDFIQMVGREYAKARRWDEQEVTDLVMKYWRLFWHIRTEQDIEKLFTRDLKP